MSLRFLTEAKKDWRYVVLKDGRQNECFLYKFQPIPPHLKKKETGNAKKRICNKWTGPGKRRRAKFEIIISNGPTTVAQSLPVGRRTKEAILSYIWMNRFSLSLKSCFCRTIRKLANSFQTVGNEKATPVGWGWTQVNNLIRIKSKDFSKGIFHRIIGFFLTWTFYMVLENYEIKEFSSARKTGSIASIWVYWGAVTWAKNRYFLV